MILVARTVGGLEETDDEIQKAGGSATLVPLNLKDFDALDRLGASIFERWGRLDAFFGNAGVLGVLTPLAHLDPKVFQELLDINVTANWRLIRSLDPLLRRSEAGRALFVTSGAARKHTAVLGRLCDEQGGAGIAGADLCGGMRRHQREGESARSRADAHRHARQGDAGRGPCLPCQRPEASGAADRRMLSPSNVRRTASCDRASKPTQFSYFTPHTDSSSLRSSKRIGAPSRPKGLAQAVLQIAQIGFRQRLQAGCRTARRSAAGSWAGSCSGCARAGRWMAGGAWRDSALPESGSAWRSARACSRRGRPRARPATAGRGLRRCAAEIAISGAPATCGSSWSSFSRSFPIRPARFSTRSHLLTAKTMARPSRAIRSAMVRSCFSNGRGGVDAPR